MIPTLELQSKKGPILYINVNHIVSYNNVIEGEGLVQYTLVELINGKSHEVDEDSKVIQTMIKNVNY